MTIAWHVGQGSTCPKRKRDDEVSDNAVIGPICESVPESGKSCKMIHCSRLSSKLVFNSKNYILLHIHEIY